jgi:hypothetical protein
MKKSSSIGRARIVAAALVVAAAGVFASVGMAGYGAELDGLSHKTPTSDQYPTAKVTICHHTHSQKNPFVTITVSQNAVPAHLRHGDTIGPCSEQPPAAPVVPAKQKSHKLLKAHVAKHKATKAKLRRQSKSKAKHESHAKNDAAKSHKPTTGPSTVHGKSQSNGQAKTKTHGPPADRGQGQGHGHDKSQDTHGQGHGQGDSHGNSGGNGNGTGKGNGH